MGVQNGQDCYEFGGFRLDPGRRQLHDPDGRVINLRTKVFDILLYLVRHAGQLVTKAELMQAVWPRLIVEENNLNQAVSALRQALGDERQAPQFIATVTGRGYQFVARVEQIAAARAAPPGTAHAESKATEPGARNPSSARQKPRRPGLLAAAAVVALAAAAIVALWPRFDGTRNEWVADGELALATTPAALVTDFSGSHTEPSLSPDGTLMAFVSNASGVEQIWIMSLPRGQPIQITSGESAATSPSWSPRNDQILFQRVTAEGVLGIWSIDPLGATEPRLVVDVGITPSFSADGATFVYAIGRSLWIARADGTERRQIQGVPAGPGFEARRSPVLSPDGKYIAFAHAEQGPASQIWLIAVDGSSPARPLTVVAVAEGNLGGIGFDPIFSADGRYVIYAAATGAVTNTHLWRVPVEGGEPEQLTIGVGGYGRPAISSNGARLVYTSKRVIFRLQQTDPATGIHRSIHESRSPIILPNVSPDGREIVFFSASTTGAQIFTIGVDGENRRQRTFDEAAANTLPVWSADGDWVYYYRDRSLRRLSRTGDRNEEVLPDFHWTSRHWLLARDDRLAYRERNLQPGVRRTVLRNLSQGGEIDLPFTYSPTEWSRDGSTILGFSQEPDTRGQMVVCNVDQGGCRRLIDAEAPLIGTEPRWSMDESRVFFRRLSDRRNYSTLWVAGADGSNPRMLFEFGPFDVEFSDSNFGITADDQVIWNQYDQADTEEIWMVQLSPEARP